MNPKKIIHQQIHKNNETHSISAGYYFVNFNTLSISIYISSNFDEIYQIENLQIIQ